jgi:hypothetical protein
MEELERLNDRELENLYQHKMKQLEVIRRFPESFREKMSPSRLEAYIDNILDEMNAIKQEIQKRQKQ